MPIAPDLCGIALDGRYELLALIGEGTFGRVYRGRDRRLDRIVAVKVIKPWWAEDPEWVAVFERETRLLARVSDPGIVQIHDVGHAPEGLYYVSELVEGENLHQHLRGGPLTAGEARAITIGLCEALAGAHAQRIVHRDVKPANVLLQARDGRVKLGDFGVARLAEGTTDGQRPSAIVGTPRYMAPEQGRNGQTTPATDVYGVGIVLYEMLAGAPPFTGDSPVALALSHLNDPPPPLPGGVPRELVSVVDRALAKEPADRYRDAGAMARALRDASVASFEPQPGEPGVLATSVAPRLAPRVDVNPSARRRTAALLGLAGALLGALVVAAVLTAGHHGAAPAARVEVPLVVNRDLGDARATLRAHHLRVTAHEVPAPGIRPGTVTVQRPIAGHSTRSGSVVRLSVAEVPRFRTVTSFAHPDVSSVQFQIRGAQWRILSTISSSKHCSLLFVDCHGTSATLLRRDGSTVQSFGLGDGSDQPRVFSTGPGIYRLRVSPASGDTRWSITIEDDY
jgi:eukaryotic-like serine/threonine-protein kinase